MSGKDSAESLLEGWCFDAMNSGTLVLMKLGVTMASHRTGLLNYFEHKITTAKVEGINNRI